MNLSPAWVELLKEAQIAAIHWSKIGESNAPDDQIFRRAVEEGWIILTQDLDFSDILFKRLLKAPAQSCSGLRTNSIQRLGAAL